MSDVKSKNKSKKVETETAVALPVGVTEFHEWSDEIIRLANAPNNDSTRFALATMILHVTPEKDKVPHSYFVAMLRKSMSNQVAAGIMHDLKAKQEAERAAELAASNATEVLPN